MIVRLFLILLLVIVAGCAPVKTTRGSAADRDPVRSAVVSAVVDVMLLLYEPAATTLVPAREMGGPFDTALLSAVRGRSLPVVSRPASGVAFDCHVDAIEADMYRVVVQLGDTRLSRLWVVKGERAYPGGAWARGE